MTERFDCRGRSFARSRNATQWTAVFASVIALMVGIGVSSASAAEDVWGGLKKDLFGDRTIADGKNLLSLETPYRAHDAALVPVTIKMSRPSVSGSHIKAVTLIIDQNPAPVAAVFSMAPDSGIASLSTRVRVNAYSDVRAIAELNDGTLFMVKRFVKASGGCSAPATKNAEIARKQMGRMKLRQFTQSKSVAAQSRMHEVQIMIRHPNNSGLQKDQLTGYYIPAHYVDNISISRSGKSLLGIEGAISLSENPMLRFSFRSGGNEKLDVRATDTEENVFEGSWALKPHGKRGS